MDFGIKNDPCGNINSKVAIYQDEKHRWGEPREWMNLIPHITFPPTWMVQMIPPFHGMIVRFRVHRPFEDETGHWTSVYLDAWERAGAWSKNEPYWEVYPFEGDVGRCSMNDTKELLRMINQGADPFA